MWSLVVDKKKINPVYINKNHFILISLLNVSYADSNKLCINTVESLFFVDS